MCRASLFYFYITLYKIWRVKYIYICKKNPLICSYLFRLYDKEQSYVLKLGRSRAFFFFYLFMTICVFLKSLYRDFICHLIWLLSTPPHHKKIKKQIIKKNKKTTQKTKRPPPNKQWQKPTFSYHTDMIYFKKRKNRSTNFTIN